MKPYENNPRKNKNAINAVAKSIESFGFKQPIVVDRNNIIIAGHTRLEASKKIGLQKVPCIYADDLTDEQVKAYRIADNKTNELAEWDFEKLEQELKSIDFDFSDFDFDFDFDFDIADSSAGNSDTNNVKTSLVERFTVPPFSVLDTRQGYWIDRVRQWKALGLESENGREIDIFDNLNKLAAKAKSGAIRENGVASIFDPLLCEIMYTWFSKKDYKVLDPFAGGSVRGIIASVCGLDYTGIELRAEQVEANRKQLNILKQFDGLTAPKWINGDSVRMNELLSKEYKADFIFTCPPYFDLEVYSKLENDLSNMSAEDFTSNYKTIIKNACDRLKENRFAVFVTSENRNRRGNFNNLLGLTIDSFLENGLHFYNELTLINQAGTKPLTCAAGMNKSRKVARCHQNVLVFVKGDGVKAAAELGEIQAKELNTGAESETD